VRASVRGSRALRGGETSGIHVFDVFVAIGNWIVKFRTFKNVFQNEFMVSFSNSSFGEIFLIFLFRFIQIQMNFAFGSQHVRRG